MSPLSLDRIRPARSAGRCGGPSDAAGGPRGPGKCAPNSSDVIDRKIRRRSIADGEERKKLRGRTRHVDKIYVVVVVVLPVGAICVLGRVLA